MYKKVLIIHHKMLHFHFSVGMLFLIVCGLEALPTDNDVHGSGLFNQLSKVCLLKFSISISPDYAV